MKITRITAAATLGAAALSLAACSGTAATAPRPAVHASATPVRGPGATFTVRGVYDGQHWYTAAVTLDAVSGATATFTWTTTWADGTPPNLPGTLPVTLRFAARSDGAWYGVADAAGAFGGGQQPRLGQPATGTVSFAIAPADGMTEVMVTAPGAAAVGWQLAG